MAAIIKKGDRVLSNDSALYGAPICDNTLGTALSDEKDERVQVRWDSGDEDSSHTMDIRRYYGGPAEAHQSDEEAADIARLDREAGR